MKKVPNIWGKRTDKGLKQATENAASRSGFALLITLSVLVIVITLTGVLTGYLDRARKDASKSKALVQANLYYADIKSFLSKTKHPKELFSMLYAAPFPLVSKDGSFSLVLACHPLNNAINIAWLKETANKKMQHRHELAQRLFDAIVQRYELTDPVRLLEMIGEALRGEGDLWVLQGHLSQNNGMISYQIFEQILLQYAVETGDRNVQKVPWKELFVFGYEADSTVTDVIAGDYLSPSLLSLLFGLDETVVKESWSKGEGALKQLAETYGITYESKLFSDKAGRASQCDVQFDYEKERFRFLFNDIEGEVSSFEFYGKQ